MRPVVGLVERRAREVRLPAHDAAFLVALARHVVEVVPAFRRGRYRLTPRGYVGWFDTPECRLSISPKIPWPNARMLLGLPPQHAACGVAESDPSLLDVLAREFTAQLRAVAGVGLVPAYSDRDAAGPFLRGKLRPADQMRDAAARAFPDRFHVTESVLDLDTPWNRIPRAVAELLLTNPELGPAARDELRDAVIPLADVPLTPVGAADFDAADAEPRAAHYRPLLRLCRVLHDGFAAASASGGRGGFLVDLSAAFERFLTDGLAAALASRPRWSVEAQPRFPVGGSLLQPDILLLRRGKPRAVLDAKWKAPGTAPDAADLHQVLAYAAITGARHVGLVYPGRRFARRTFPVFGSDIRVSLLRVQVVGTVEECERSVGRLGRFVARKHQSG
jgi:5-methylcytosine-specific restriction enzyme subunit McrC